MLDLISHAIDASIDRTNPFSLSATYMDNIEFLETQVQSLKQQPKRTSDAEAHDAETAELYRLATLIYLRRAVRGDPRDSKAVKNLVDQSFAILNIRQFSLRLWPLFIIALEAHDEERRRIILFIFTESLKRQPSRSIALLKQMVLAAWVQQDLQLQDLDPLVLYDFAISRNRVPPCFA